MVEHCREGWVQLKVVGTRAHAPDGVDGLRLKALHTSIRHRPSREAHDRGSHVLMGRQGGGCVGNTNDAPLLHERSSCHDCLSQPTSDAASRTDFCARRWGLYDKGTRSQLIAAEALVVLTKRNLALEDGQWWVLAIRACIISGGGCIRQRGGCCGESNGRRRRRRRSGMGAGTGEGVRPNRKAHSKKT